MYRIAVIMLVKQDDDYFRQAAKSVLDSELDERGDVQVLLIMVLDPAMSNDHKDSIFKWNLSEDAEAKTPFVNTSLALGRVPEDVPDSHSRVAYLLNDGLTLADTLQFEFVARMDADDLSMPDRFQKQLQFLLDNPKVGVVGTSWKAIGPDREPRELVREPYEHDRLVQERLQVGRPCFAHPTVMMRMQVFLDLGSLYPVQHAAEDYALWCEIVTKTGWKFANTWETLYLYRYHDGQLANTDTDRLLSSAQNIHAQYFGGN